MKHTHRFPLLGWIGLGLLGSLVFVAIAAPLLAPYDPAVRSGTPFMRPGAGHLLGTNDVGQDIFSDLIYGARVSLAVGFAAAVLATAVGTLAGLTAGYSGGWVDTVLMRIVDVTLSLPFLPLVIVVGVFFGGGIWAQVAVIAGVAWAVPARELRPPILSARHRADVEAAKVMGASGWYVLRNHLIPIVAPLLAPQLVRAANVAILTEASLSFLGLGQAGLPSWGTMLYYAQSRGAMLTDAWRWWVLPAGTCIALTVVSLAFLGYALEERGLPRLRRAPSGGGGLRRQGGVAQAADDVLDVHDLFVRYGPEQSCIVALAGASLRIGPGEAVGLVGGSGSGKSSFAGVAFGSPRAPGQTLDGSVCLAGLDLSQLGCSDLRRLHGNDVSLVPQDAMGALNPVIRVGRQLAEAVQVHSPCTRLQAATRARALLELVGIAGNRESAFPHELSGGMRQRVVLAMAIAHHPRLLIADEPTTGLDPVVRREFLDLLVKLRSELGMAVLLISHDLSAVLGLADRLVVLDRGVVVEQGPAALLSIEPSHPVTRRLLDSRLAVLGPASRAPEPSSLPPVVLRLEEVSKSFGRAPSAVVAADRINLEVRRGQAVGLVGRSGAGKSTLARLACGLQVPDGGRVLISGQDIACMKGLRGRTARSELHLVFQDPYESLPPAMRVRDIVAEPLAIWDKGSAEERVELARQALIDVDLDPQWTGSRFPHELSGGERQRVAMARAIIARPALIVADEPAAMLDTTLVAELADLMDALRKRHGMGWLLITHELGLAARVCDRIVVLDEGKIVDEGPTGRVLSAPACPRAQELVAAAKERVNV